MKILLTAFDPFGGEAKNPALEAMKKVNSEFKGVQLIKLELPTVFHKSAQVIKEAIIKHKPDIVLSIGQAGGRPHVMPERIAIDIDDARIPDNENNQPIDLPIQKDGKAAYFSQLPIKAMVKKIQEAGLPASISNSAGSFVCNHIMYQVQYLIEKEFPTMKAGFIHVPFVASQVINKPKEAFMNLDDIVLSLEKAIEAIIEFNGEKDLKVLGGSLH